MTIGLCTEGSNALMTNEIKYNIQIFSRKYSKNEDASPKAVRKQLCHATRKVST